MKGGETEGWKERNKANNKGEKKYREMNAKGK